MILQANCSEIVAKLDATTKQEAKEILESIGLKVIKYDPYLSLYNGGRYDQKYWMIIDPKNPNSPDFSCHAKLSISKASYYDEKGIWIYGDQHCQHQLYETIKRISEALPDVTFMGHDGGGSFDEIYGEWLDDGAKPVGDFQKEIRNEVKILLRDPIIINTVRSFETVDIAMKKGKSQQDKYRLIADAVVKSTMSRKEELVKMKKESILKERTKCANESPGYPVEDFEMPEDKKLLGEILSYSGYAITGTLYLMVTNKKLAQAFLQNDQKLLAEFEDAIRKQKRSKPKRTVLGQDTL